MRTNTRSLVTLADVLRLALPSGTEVLAGNNGLDRSISWARSLGSRPVSLGSIESGELVLVQNSAGQFSSDPRLLPRLISDLAEAGVGAFVVSDACSEKAIAAANDAQTPLLRIPSDTSIAEAERSIVSLIIDRDGQIRRRLDQIYEHLVSCLMDEQGSVTVAGVVADATGKQVVVLDEYVHVQVSVPVSEPPASLVAACADHIQSLPRGGRRSAPIPLSGGGDSPQGALIIPLMLKGTAAGYLALIGTVDSFTEFDTELAHRATSVLAMEVAKQRAVTEVQLRVQGDLVEDLLDGTFPSEEAAVFRARSLGYDLNLPHVVCCFSVASAPSDDNVIRPLRWLEPARRELRRIEPGVLLRDTGPRLSALLPLRRLQDDEAIQDRVDEIRGILTSSLENLALSAGVGRVCRSPSEFAVGHRQAQQALVAAELMHAGACTIHFDQLGADRLLLELRASQPLREFVTDVIGPLEDYDRQHRSELVSTVAMFIACNGNHVRTAQELHLHRNSLLYRLDRAQKVLGRELDDSDTRLAVQLALRGRRLLAHTGSDESAYGLVAAAAEPINPTRTRKRARHA
jgi:PucR family transcriptional regulator, purine catabolism regulatory protein